jgi:hypothetical protein
MVRANNIKKKWLKELKRAWNLSRKYWMAVDVKQLGEMQSHDWLNSALNALAMLWDVHGLRLKENYGHKAHRVVYF